MTAIMSHHPSALPEAKCPSSPTTAAPEATRPRWRASLTAEALFLIGLAILAYWPVVECGYVWDDDKYLTDNRLITEPGGLVPIWRQVGATPQYYPMVFSTFWLEYRLWGLHPMGYHLTNVALHAVNAILVWRLLRRWHPAVAWWTAALFAVHPVHVESVAWITERKNVLSGVFYLASFLSYLRYRDSGHWRRYLLAFVLFGAALLSKSVTATLPAAILVVLWWRDGRIGWSDIRPLIPFFVIGIASGLHTAWIERQFVGARTADLDWSWLERLLVAGRVPWMYLEKLVYPWPLIFFYPRWMAVPSELKSWFFPLATLLLIGGLWRSRDRIGRLPLACVLFFGGTLFPVLGLVPVYPMRFSIIADHFQYLASLGPLVLMAVVLARCESSWQLIGRMVGTAGLLALVATCWFQIEDFRDETCLWTRTLAKNPDCYLCHMNLQTNPENLTVEQICRRVIELAPQFEHAWHCLGNSLLKQGRSAEAIDCFQEALKLFPEYPESHFALSHAYEDLGQLQLAIHHARHSLAMRQEASKYANLGRLLIAAGSLDEANQVLDATLKLDPDQFDGLVNRASLHAMHQEFAQAEMLFRRAHQLQPEADAPIANLGKVCWEQQRYSDAMNWFERTLEIAPDDLFSLGRKALFLAAAPEKNRRDSLAALKLAEELCGRTREQVADLLVIRSIAKAVNRQFESANGDLTKAQALAQQSVSFDLSRLRLLFRNNSPYELPVHSASR